MARLGQGVLDKGAVRLLGLGDAQIGLAHQFHIQRGQHGLQLGQFAAIIRCEHDFHDDLCQFPPSYGHNVLSLQ